MPSLFARTRFSKLTTLLACASLCCFLPNIALSDDWPGWRGPTGDGISPETSVVRNWQVDADGTATNLRWKFPLSSPGHASPVVSGETVFLMGFDERKQQRLLIALDRKTGKSRWRQVVSQGPLETKHRLNSHASGTPAADGQQVYVAVLEVDGRTIPAPNVGKPRPVTPGRVLLAAYDFAGNKLWKTELGSFVSAHGFSSSPVLFENLVILNCDHDGPAYLIAVNRQTGQVVWKTPRPNGVRSYCTPLIRKIEGHWQLMLSGSQCVAAYNPRTGKQLWLHDGPTDQFVASLVMQSGLVYVTGGFPDKHLLAIDPTGRGNITKTHVRWHRERRGVSYVPSPIVLGNHLLVVADNGILSCFEATTGVLTWQHRLGRRHSASPVAAGGLVYFPDDDGITWVIRPGRAFELVSKNSVNEPISASPAISDREFFLRTDKHLYCFGERGSIH